MRDFFNKNLLTNRHIFQCTQAAGISTINLFSNPYPMHMHDFKIYILNSNQLKLRLQHYYTTLSRVEKKRANRFVTDTLRERFICAHGALREILSQHTKVPAHQLLFAQNAYGKPHLHTDCVACPVQFNLSHSRQMIAIIVHKNKAVGIDIEAICREKKQMEIAKVAFSQAEYAELSVIPAQDQIAAFYRGWTRKEAFVKATGKGFSYGTQNFSVALAKDKPPALLHAKDDDANHYDFSTPPAPKGFALAVCVFKGATILQHDPNN